MKNFFRQLSSFIMPVIMGLVLPYFVLTWERPQNTWETSNLIVLKITGILLLPTGFLLFIACARMFIQIGKGTIMPWDPTKKLIVSSLYAYVRNPMILGVLIIEVGWAMMFGSRSLTILAILFFLVNTVYFIFSEEPGLEKRFGQDYKAYKANVPRWIPRLKPWKP